MNFVRVSANSPKLLLLDALGALITCMMTGWVLTSGWVPTGLPAEILRVLAILAGVLFVTSLTAYLFSAKPSAILRYITVANVAYCVVTLIVCVMRLNLLTIWGVVYFSLELTVVLLLASWEWRVAMMSK